MRILSRYANTGTLSCTCLLSCVMVCAIVYLFIYGMCYYWTLYDMLAGFFKVFID